MLIQVDMKEKFKEILEEILFKMEELSDEEWLLDINNINNFIYHLKENKGPIIQKVKNLFLKPRDDILKNDERLFRKYENFKISKDLIENFDEEKYGNMRGYVAKVVSLLEHKIQGGGIQNDEEKFEIKYFYNELKNTSNQKLASQIYKHYFLIIRKILHLIIDTLISKLDFIPYFIKCVCNMIEILGKNSYNNKLTNFDILSLIGKYFLNNIINLYLFDERYIAMLDFAPISQYSKQNYNVIKNILKTLTTGDLFSKDNFPNLIPFNALFYKELLPKLFNFYKSLTIVDFTPYLDELISGKIKENDFSYNFFETNPDEIFRNMSICFNIKNYHSFLTLFKIYTLERQDRREFYKRGDKNCVNNMKQYFGAVADYKEFTSFTGHNINKEPNIFHLYYKNISKDFDLNENDDTQIIFSLPETNLQEIESEEEFRENEVKKMKNRLCLLLYKVKDLDEEDYSIEDRKDLLSIIKRLISISKEEVIGKTLMILIDKITKQENNEFNYKLFEDLHTGIEEYSNELENSYQKMSLANEYLRFVILKIKTILLNNENLLLYNSYLDIENYLETNQFYLKKPKQNNFSHFVKDFFEIKDDRLQKYYDKPTTEDFISIDDEFAFKEEDDNGEKLDFSKNPIQVNTIIEYMKNIPNDVNENYRNIIIDLVSSRIYDCLISHKPDNEDKIIFNELIKGNKKLIYEIENVKQNLEQKVFYNIKFCTKKFVFLRGIYQKKLSLNEILNIFGNYYSFIKGKKEMVAADENIAFMKLTISKVYIQNLITTGKYGCLFEGGYKDLAVFISSLSNILIDINNNNNNNNNDNNKNNDNNNNNNNDNNKIT